MTLPRNRAVVLREGEAPSWTLRLAARMAVHGVQMPDRRILRREVWAKLVAVAHDWFRQVTALPGDHFDQFVRDVELLVTEAKPSRVTCEIRSRQMIAAGHGWDTPPPDNCMRAYEVRLRRPFGWWLP